MEKKPHSVKRGPRVKKVMRQQSSKSTQGPSKEKVTSSVDHGKDDVPPPPSHFIVESTQGPSKEKVANSVDHGKDDVPPPPSHFSVNLCFPNEEEVAEIKRKCKVLRLPPVTSEDYFQKLGFVSGYATLLYISRKKKAKFPDKSLYALGRSWFKEGVTNSTKENKCVSKDMHKKCYSSGDAELKGYLKEFVERAKAAKILARMSRQNRKTVRKQVLSTSAPCRGKMLAVPTIPCLDDIVMAIEQSGN